MIDGVIIHIRKYHNFYLVIGVLKIYIVFFPCHRFWPILENKRIIGYTIVDEEFALYPIRKI